MLLLQFSTSHYCRKARLALGYKKIPYRVENLTPGFHIRRVKPLVGLTTLPVLLPELPNYPTAIGDSSRIFAFLEEFCPSPPLFFSDPDLQSSALMLEDWLDESIGVATRFIYYQFRSQEGLAIDNSWFSQLIIAIVKNKYGINQHSVALAQSRLTIALDLLQNWVDGSFLVGDRLSFVDLTAAALLSPLALIPEYRQSYPKLFDQIIQVHHLSSEPLPQGLAL